MLDCQYSDGRVESLQRKKYLEFFHGTFSGHVRHHVGCIGESPLESFLARGSSFVGLNERREEGLMSVAIKI